MEEANDTLFVRPAKGRGRVHFRGREEPLALEGEFVPADDYWLNCLDTGRVDPCDPPDESLDTAGEAEEDEANPQPQSRRRGRR